MADHALPTQLPSMVRKPKAVWPGLVKMGMYQKQIAGDGNCLFASLSDQLYGTPVKHPEIRANIIEHMRTFRPLFEHYVHKDDVQQRRTLRSAKLAAPQDSEDSFEEYLALMSRSGTYGGEPELVAFCQVYNQDVTVHLPRIKNFERDSISYTNEHREATVLMPPLHICYGGDEVTRAHYDSARSRDGSTPRSRNSPLFKPQETTRNSLANSIPEPDFILTNRSIRSSRSDLSSELIQDILQRNKKEVEINLDQLSDKNRVRSPSVTSSQRSSSSKRSLDDDGESLRSSKRADRRKSTRRRADMTAAISDADNEVSPRLSVDLRSTDTAPSTQDTTASSDIPPSEYNSDPIKTTCITPEDQSNDFEPAVRAAKPRAKPQTRTSLNVVTNGAQISDPSTPRHMSVAERPKSTLRA
ncbi:hypothetical protein A1O3_05116 [Capronia epimyces CBS 606.96]|uniref:OTU domain-containing protein n=1 Tax=Capronia epimyces CBS 606.96 TaxID=1182542 RepID=W9XW53_9EURO|nr:uncharacterized protein A1O3_05116 [Capronia epimyces CBS 606.96]EXJ84448.1 hypothetical protein A1O3_05116 [Capronia epimyces CBS 606.96]